MAGSLNKVMLIGRLGQDPKLAYTASGSPVANFTMATDESFTDKSGQKQERTEWHRVVVWSRQAEMVANYLSKGRLVFVEGRLQTREWEDQNGQKRYTTEVVASRVQFLDSQKSAGQSAGYDAGEEGYYDEPPAPAAPRQRPQPAAPQGGRMQQGRPQDNRPRQQRPADEDQGPAFPSEASGMDDVPF